MSELKKKIKEIPMLGFEQPSHMVTHPSTDKAQCCLTLEIFKKLLGKSRVQKSPTTSQSRRLKKYVFFVRQYFVIFLFYKFCVRYRLQSLFRLSENAVQYNYNLPKICRKFCSFCKNGMSFRINSDNFKDTHELFF